MEPPLIWIPIETGMINRARTGPGKPGKSLEFCCGIFQDWKVLEKDYSLLILESSGNLSNSD